MKTIRRLTLIDLMSIIAVSGIVGGDYTVFFVEYLFSIF
jgi:hypothetical protein